VNSYYLAVGVASNCAEAIAAYLKDGDSCSDDSDGARSDEGTREGSPVPAAAIVVVGCPSKLEGMPDAAVPLKRG